MYGSGLRDEQDMGRRYRQGGKNTIGPHLHLENTVAGNIVNHRNNMTTKRHNNTPVRTFIVPRTLNEGVCSLVTVLGAVFDCCVRIVVGECVFLLFAVVF